MKLIIMDLRIFIQISMLCLSDVEQNQEWNPLHNELKLNPVSRTNESGHCTREGIRRGPMPISRGITKGDKLASVILSPSILKGGKWSLSIPRDNTSLRLCSSMEGR